MYKKFALRANYMVHVRFRTYRHKILLIAFKTRIQTRVFVFSVALTVTEISRLKKNRDFQVHRVQLYTASSRLGGAEGGRGLLSNLLRRFSARARAI